MVQKADPFASNYELIINGVGLDPSFYELIPSVTYEDESDKISTIKFDVVFQRPVVGGTSLDLINMKFFVPGNLVVLKGGYGSDLKHLMAAYIVDVEPDFPENGPPKISITCYDHLYKLTMLKSEKGEIFKDVLDHNIVQKVGTRHNMIISVTDSAGANGIRKTTKKQKRTQKRGSSDYDFLQELAKLNDCHAYTRYAPKQKRFELFFEPPNDKTKPMIDFVYGQGDVPYDVTSIDGQLSAALLSFKPKLSVSTQFTKYRVICRDKTSNKKIEVEMTLDDFLDKQADLKIGGGDSDKLLKKNAAVAGGTVMQKTFGTYVETVTNKTFKSADEGREYLTLHLKKIARDFITGTGKIKGNEILKSRQVHSFSGIGSMFDGNYYIKKVKGTFANGGFVQNLQVRRILKEEV